MRAAPHDGLLREARRWLASVAAGRGGDRARLVVEVVLVLSHFHELEGRVRLAAAVQGAALQAEGAQDDVTGHAICSRVFCPEAGGSPIGDYEQTIRAHVTCD